MAVTATPIFIQAPKLGLQSIVPADTTTKKTVATAGANGSKVTGLVVSSTDTAARVLGIYITRSATSYLLGAVTIALASGSDGAAPSVDLLAKAKIPGLPIDNDGQPYILLESGDTLQVAATTTVTAAKEIDIVAVYGNF